MLDRWIWIGRIGALGARGGMDDRTEDGAEAAAAEVSPPTPPAPVQAAPAPALRLHESEICSRLVAENERLRAEV